MIGIIRLEKKLKPYRPLYVLLISWKEDRDEGRVEKHVAKQDAALQNERDSCRARFDNWLKEYQNFKGLHRMALNAAIVANDIAAVRTALASPDVVAHINDAVELDGTTPLIKAVEKGSLDIVQELLKVRGIDVNAAMMQDTTPLMQASYYGHLEVVQALLAVAEINVNAATKQGQTALMGASFSGHPDVVRVLLAKTGIDVNAAHNGGYTALHFAAEMGHLDVAHVLLTVPGININAADNEGYTPLYLAAVNGHREIVRALLADPRLDLTVRRNDGTPLYADILTEYRDLYREVRKNAAYNRRAPAIAAWKRIRSRRRRPAPATAPAGGGRKTRRRRISRKR